MDQNNGHFLCILSLFLTRKIAPPGAENFAKEILSNDPFHSDKKKLFTEEYFLKHNLKECCFVQNIQQYVSKYCHHCSQLLFLHSWLGMWWVSTGCPRKKFLLGFAFKHSENDTKEFHLGHFSTALSVQILKTSTFLLFGEIQTEIFANYYRGIISKVNIFVLG